MKKRLLLLSVNSIFFSVLAQSEPCYSLAVPQSHKIISGPYCGTPLPSKYFPNLIIYRFKEGSPIGFQYGYPQILNMPNHGATLCCKQDCYFLPGIWPQCY